MSLPASPFAQLVGVRYGPNVEFIPFCLLEYRVTIAVVVESFGRPLDDQFQRGVAVPGGNITAIRQSRVIGEGQGDLRPGYKC